MLKGARLAGKNIESSIREGRGITGLLAAALVLCTFLAYGPALSAGFIWDDDDHVTHNPVLRDAEGLRRLWFDPFSIPQYYPLVHTTFWIEYQIWELDARGYHAVNVLLHALGAFLLMCVLRRLGIPGGPLVAAVFALHPVHVESVAWITERKNVLSGIFYFLALLAWMRWRPITATEQTAAPGRPLFYGLAVLAFVAALLAKTVTCSLPAVILLLVWWRRGRITRADVLPTLPLFVVGVCLAVVTVRMEQHHVFAQGVEWDLSLVERSLIAGRALWFYVGKLLLPVGLAFSYGQWNVDAGTWWHYLFPLSVGGVVLWLWIFRRRWGRGPLTAVLVFAGTLVPALGFIDVYPMRFTYVADHYQYLASAALITLAGAGAATFWKCAHASCRRHLTVAAGLVLLVLGILTWRQSRAYEGHESLWTHNLEQAPHAWLAHYNLGKIRIDQGRIDEGIDHFRKALGLHPHNADAHVNISAALLRQNRHDEARSELEAALRIRPGFAEAHNNFACLLFDEGRLEEAQRHLEQALQTRPLYRDALINLGQVLDGQEKHDAAIEVLQRALRMNARDLMARFHLGNSLLATGRTDDALGHYAIVLELMPDHLDTRLCVAEGLRSQGKLDFATAQLVQVLAYQPGHESAAAALVDLIAERSTRQPAETVTLALSTVSPISAQAPELLDALAAALARSGRTAEARAAAEAAIQRATAAGRHDAAARYRTRLEQYR